MEKRSPVKRWKLKSRLKLGKLPTQIWQKIGGYLSLEDEASLFLSSRHLYNRRDRQFMKQLSKPSERIQKLKFLFRCPELFPGRTLCLPCATYHYDSYDEQEDHTFDEEDYRSIYCEGIPMDSCSWLEWPGDVADEQRRVRSRRENRSRRRDDVETPWTLIQDSFFPQTYPYGDEDRRTFQDSKFLWTCSYELYATMQVLQKPEAVPLPQLCSHAEDSPDLRAELQALIKQIPKPWEDFEEEWDLRGRVWRCTWCPTEYYLVAEALWIDKVRAQQKAQYSITINRVMDFGDCYSRHSREWKALWCPEVEGVIETKAFEIAGKRSLMELYTVDEYGCNAKAPKSAAVYPLITKSAAKQLGCPEGQYYGQYTFDCGLELASGHRTMDY